MQAHCKIESIKGDLSKNKKTKNKKKQKKQKKFSDLAKD